MRPIVFNRLGIGYRIGKVQLSASFSTQFTSPARYRSKNLSAIAPYVTDQRFGDIYPGFEIGFSYHLDFGRKYKSVDEIIYKWEFRRGSTYFTDEVYLLWNLKYISYREGSDIS